MGYATKGKGEVMDKKKCKKIVYPKGRYGAFHPYGCSRNAVKAGYCKQHHPDSVVARIKKSKERDMR